MSPPHFVGQAHFVLEHETRFELAIGLRPILATRSSLVLAAWRLLPLFFWQEDAGVDSIEKFRLKRSYRCVSVNSGGRVYGAREHQVHRTNTLFVL